MVGQKLRRDIPAVESISTFLFVLAVATVARGQDAVLHTFERQPLTDIYYSEGATTGDIDGDGKADIVHGPYWFAGPEFKQKREIYPAVAQPRKGYANNFFSWVYDFDGDGSNDVLSVGLPGSAAVLNRKPGHAGLYKPWQQTAVLPGIGNESPQFLNLVGDQRPELVCVHEGRFGYAAPDWKRPLAPWSFHPISKADGFGRFTHGLGLGDVDGDDRLDVLFKGGWFQQPKSLDGDPAWKLHPVRFAGPGGADMFTYDVDGDGDNDVITSLAAHTFGLAWYEQLHDGDQIVFRQHLIMGDHASQNRYGVLFSELHAVHLADIDGDGLKDIVTGKTYWSHHTQSPLWDAGAVVYWFKLVRSKNKKVDWVPYQADGESGIGRQLTVADINGDSLPDIVVGGMKGAHVLIHKKTKVDQTAWQKAQPKLYKGGPPPSTAGAERTRGPLSPIDEKTGRVANAIEGEKMKMQVTAGNARSQKMGGFAGDRWSGADHLWWTGARPGDKLSLALAVEKAGVYDLEVVMTCAKNYGIVRLSLDDKPLGKPVDLYNPDVITTGVLKFRTPQVTAGQHKLVVEIVGANTAAEKSYMVGLDYVRFRSVDDKSPDGAAAANGALPTDADGRPLNLDFEKGTLDDWTASGKAFEGQPIKGDTVARRRNDMRSDHQGQFWIGGFEKLTDAPVGALTSAPFTVTKRWATFRANGGNHAETRVELVSKETGKVIHRTIGADRENLRLTVVDLQSHVGKEIFIRLVDEHRGHWGHLNFDDFRLHQLQPGRITPTKTVLATDDYPHAGLSADEAARAMKLPKGFSVSVCAAEPEVKQPIAMAIDDRGRVWVAEAYEYPRRAADGEGRDRILIFADDDGDGKFDSRTVFAEGLNLVSGLEVGFGGVWVGAAPYLLFIPDRDADDVPDGKPQVVLDGWGYHDTHETLNAFIWGPDGWLYGCHGVFTHSLVGKPGSSKEQRTPLNAAIWRYHPTRHQFEVFAQGTSNPWGVDFNDYGQAFCTACVIPHLFHVIQGARYQRQAGAHVNLFTYDDIKTIADHRHYLGATPHAGNNKSDEAGGGHAHAGAMIYLGGVWPEQYRGQIFMNNIHGQRINMDTLTPNGSGYVGGHGPDFLLTSDRASQILNLRYGPDGQAYMIDWYDMQACHHGNRSLHDRTNGRIFKVTYGEQSGAASTDLKKLDDSELVELTLHKNDYYVRHARRILQERAASGALDPSVRAALSEIATTHQDATRRLRAAWALHVTGGLDDGLIDSLLDDRNQYVRAWSVQLALDRQSRPSADLLARFAALAGDDPSPTVRLYLASAAQRLPLGNRWPILDGLVRHSEDADDHNLPLMYWYAAEPLATADPQRALAFGLAAGETIPLLRDYMLRRIGSADTSASLAVLVEGLGKTSESALQLTFLNGIRAALRGQRRVQPPAEWKAVYQNVSKSVDPRVRLQATALGVTFGDESALRSFRSLAASKTADSVARRTAVESLLAANDTQLVATLQVLIGDPTLRDVALRGLAQYDDAATSRLVLTTYPKLSPTEKRIALATLCSRSNYGVALLRAIERKQIPGSDLSADLVRQLQHLKNDEIDELLDTVWGSVRETAADKLKLIATYKAMLSKPPEREPDAALGRAVFAKTCQRCHVLYGVGAKVGPDLTGSNRADLNYLLSNVVDPSAVMAKEYLPTAIVTDDGRVVTGIVRFEDKKSVTVQTPDATIVIPKDEIEERILGKKSMMPDDQLKQFGEHEVRSLVAYLSGKRQAPMLATADNLALLFNGKDLAGWSGNPRLWSVDNGEIVGVSPGIKNNEFLISDLLVGDFELTLQIKLTPNAGNSGIQFRSKAVSNGSVSGYQADAGAGWWGKLYEEHGRALLWKKAAEEAVNLNGWNEYRIVAVGDHIRTWINGSAAVDLHDPDGARRGILAFQIHSGGPMEVRFKDLKLSLLNKATPSTSAAEDGR